MTAWQLLKNKAPMVCVETAVPEPKDTEVLLEVTHCGVCHSDLCFWEGYYDLGGGKRMMLVDRGIKFPMIMGHEVVGRVVKLGPKAEGVSVGESRLVYPWIGCRTCGTCLSGQDHMCSAPQTIGVYTPGGYGSHVLVPHARFLLDYGSIDPAVAATYACSGITVYAAIKKVLPMPPDSPIVMIGAGGLGLNGVSILKALGHRKIAVVDIDAQKRAAAVAAGAHLAIDGSQPAVDRQIIEACGGPVSAIIDLVNTTETVGWAFNALAMGGKLVHVGLYGGDFNLPLAVVALRAITLQGVKVGTIEDLRELVAMAEAGKLAPLPTTIVPKAQANEALMRLHAGDVRGRLILHDLETA
jgi:alcohol dehydrogenase, propanol-preferring